MNQRGGRRDGAGRKRETPTASEFRFIAELLVGEIGKQNQLSSEDLTRLAQYFFTQARRQEQQDNRTATPTKTQKTKTQKEKVSAVRVKTFKAIKTNLPHAVTVIQPRCPRGESMRWNRERYEATDVLLSEGYTITRNLENADYHTEKGNVMSWRTVQALLKLGVLVPVVV